MVLEPVAESQQELLGRLWQLYAHDLAEFRGISLGDDGCFAWSRWRDYLGDADRCAYLIRADGALAGFALVRGVVTPPRILGEFFVARSVRRRGVGQAAVAELLRRHPGEWEIAFQEHNPAAARFWRGVVREVLGVDPVEERRPVPGKPHLPPDVWLSFRA